jgi:HK97 family phage major capsid protein
MDRKTLVRAAKSAGWTGKTLDSLKEWAESEGIGEFRVGKDAVPFDKIDDVWAKTVTISVAADAGEDVVVNDASAQTEEMDEDEDLEAKAEDEDEMSDEDKKQFRAWQQGNKAKQERSQKNFRAVMGANAKAANLRTSKTGYNSREAQAKKAYDRAVNDGTSVRGKRPIFNSADECEQFGAAFRLMATKGGFRDYSKVNDDLAIIGKTAGSTTDNAWAGTLIVSEVAPQIIDLLHDYGAARQIAGVTDMPDGVFDTKRKTGDMSFSYVSESGTISETNPTFDQVELVAKKVAGIARLSNELLNDSAFNLGEEVARSSAAGAGYFEDQDYFLGSHGTHGGLAGAIDSSSTYDAALSSGWEDYTIAKLQAWRGMVPAEAWKSGTVKIAASSAFVQSVLYRFALSAGGNQGQSLLSGITNGNLHWDGIPIVLTEVLPSTYTADQTVAYIGSFERGTKFGVVRGSEELSSSSDRYWDQDQFAWRFKERIAFNFHDVGGASSEVIALKD